jgi:serine/threonine protein kinase
MGTRPKWLKKRKISDADVGFLSGSDIFQAIPEQAKMQLLACMAPVAMRAGERFIEQGKEANSLYLIQDGACTIIDERDGIQTPVATRKPGDLVGEMALCTDEKRTAHVDAETDMKLWRMTRAEFDEMCLAYPSLREFITEIVTNRIAGSKFVPHRSVGKYIIDDVIGEGGWSIVYRGVHKDLNMLAAVKMLKHSMAMDADFQAKFCNEADIVSGLKHDNIVQVYDVEHLYRTVFIVMEYLSGPTLECKLKQAPGLDLPTTLDILMQVSRGLGYAHGQGIIHQDIKPANIFIEAGDRAKIVDFGLACHVGMREESDLAGTPYYMAPEQIDGDPVDERTDIYSLGITAFEMATGRKPFPGPDVGEILKAHRETPVPDPSSLNADLPSRFIDFIQRATQKDPSARYQTIVEVISDLESLAERRLVRQALEGGKKLEKTALLMSYCDVDKHELTRLVEEFGERLKQLGVTLSVGSFQRGKNEHQE